jgi:hypothetical protein
MDTDFKEECFLFNALLRDSNYKLKEVSENDRNVCKIISNLKIVPVEALSFNYKNIKKIFLSSIYNLGKDTKEYYKTCLPHIKKIKVSAFDNGYAEIAGDSKKQSIYITKKPFKDVDFIAFSHELGHVPYLINGAKGDYFEYSEVLSIFLEYLACINLYEDKAKEFFLRIRMLIAKDEAKSYLYDYNESSNIDNYQYIHFANMKRNNIKYIYSLEYVLYLIEMFQTDKKELNKIIDSIICESSTFKKYEKDLGFDISSCKRLIKEASKN